MDYEKYIRKELPYEVNRGGREGERGGGVLGSVSPRCGPFLKKVRFLKKIENGRNVTCETFWANVKMILFGR